MRVTMEMDTFLNEVRSALRSWYWLHDVEVSDSRIDAAIARLTDEIGHRGRFHVNPEAVQDGVWQVMSGSEV